MRRLQSFKLQFLTGRLEEVFDVLKEKTETMADAECDCVLFIDEMQVAAGIEYDRYQDCFLGTVTLPPKNIPVNHALVFMVGDLTFRWKEAVAYHFTGRAIDGELLKKLVLQLVCLCFETGLKVVVTSNIGAANRAMW